MTRNKVDGLEKYTLPLWFIANLCIGVYLVHDFGISFDEWSYYIYAKNSVDAYTSVFPGGHPPVFGPSFLQYYGPAFVILPELIVRFARSINPNVFAPDIWHYSYFIAFLLGGLSLFSISRRWFNAWSAWGILLLYNCQPILWGHAFINPKDIPFMAFFLLTLWSGLRLADSLGAPNPTLHLQPKIIQYWGSIDEGKRHRLMNILKAAAFASLIMIAMTWPLKYIVGRLVIFLGGLDQDTFAGRWFQSIAPHANSLTIDHYVLKAQSLLWKAESGLILTGIFLTLIYFSWVVITENKTPVRKQITSSRKTKSIRLRIAGLLPFFRNPALILAGILLGLATSIRILGPLAGLIIILHLAVSLRQRSIPVILAYLFYAGLATYVTWPYLWSNPLGHLIESMKMMSNYPWTGRVLFDGQLFRPDQLPLSYLPTLLNIQLTEPFIIVLYAGLILLIFALLRTPVRIDLFLILVMGAFLPITSLILFRVTMYDNYRQITFVVPQLLLLAGIALETIFSAIRQRLIRFLVLAALVFPGINAIVHLHPYEYVYYNSFIGGTRGASRRFEMDYWATSYREAAGWLNSNAPSGATIWADDPGDLLEFYLQGDLNLHPHFEENAVHYDYVVSTTRYNNDLNLYPDAKVVYLIQRAGAVFAVVKKP